MDSKKRGSRMRSLVVVVIAAAAAFGCRLDGTEVYRNEEIGWQMRIAQGCQRLDADAIDDIRKRGEMLLGRAVEGDHFRTRVKPLLWCQLDKRNMFTSNIVSLEGISREPYLADYRTVHELIGMVLQGQDIPHRITTGEQDIDGRTFSTFTLTLYDGNDRPVATQKQYRRFFGEKELSVTLSYSDSAKGARLESMWHNSRFEPESQ